MGQEFGKNGIFLGQSDILDFSDIKSLQASLAIPIPRHKIYTFSANADAPGNTVNITKEFINYKNGDKIGKIKAVAEMLTKIYTTAKEFSHINLITEGFTSQDSDLGVLKRLLQRHEATNINEEQKEKIYKNYISTSIQRIVSDIRNVPLATSPITMDDLQELSAHSPKGQAVAQMSMYNPTTKYLMQIQNMTGKNVIGISAVGQKVFFNLQYYFNEAVASKSLDRLRYIGFHSWFNGIEGRSKGEINLSNKFRIANTSFEGAAELKGHFDPVSDVDAQLREKYNITDADIQNKTDNYIAYQEELFSKFPEEDTSLMLSEILSAATDNAKELILSKINAGDNLAKCHLYLLTLGFDINDVVTFMTSPAIDFVNTLSEVNMLNPYFNKSNMHSAANFAMGAINTNAFIKGFLRFNDDDGISRRIAYSTKIKGILQDYLNSHQISTTTEVTQKETKRLDISDTANLMRKYIRYRVANPNADRIDFKKALKQSGGVVALESTIERVVKGLTDISKKIDLDQAEQDIVTFKKVLSNADEMSTLGSMFLGLNQGIPSSKNDLLKWTSKLRRAVTSRERTFSLFGTSEKGESPFEHAVKQIMAKTVANVEEDEVRQILRKAEKLGIMGNFDPDSWVRNKNIEIEDGEGQKDTLNYREVTKDYYNLLKGTYNIFDVVDSVPQYKAIVDLLQSVYLIDDTATIKGKLMNQLYSKLEQSGQFLGDSERAQLSKYVNDLLIYDFFRNSTLKFPVEADMDFIDSFYKTKRSAFNTEAFLNNPTGLASFKRVFEAAILQLKSKGEYNGEMMEDYESNSLLQEFMIKYDNFGRPYLSTPLNMFQLDDNSSNKMKLQEYIEGMKAFDQFMIGDHSLLEWLQAYNLFVNQNQYGADRLTALFKYGRTDGTIIDSYYKHLSSIESIPFEQSQFKETLDQSVDDMLIKFAPRVSPSQLNTSKSKYVKVFNANGGFDLMVRTDMGTYEKAAPYIKGGLNSSNSAVSIDQNSNYALYQTLSVGAQNIQDTLNGILSSNNLSELTDFLKINMESGAIKVFKIC